MDPKNNQSSAPAARPLARPAAPRGNMMGNRTLMVVVAVVVLVVLLVGGYMWKQQAMSAGVKGDKYQALFLSNGQVYFGKLKNVTESYVTLTDIYYLQVQQAVQPAQGDNSTRNQPKVSLAKLGSELHGPEDEMHVNRDQVLFWENLKDDGKVVTAIKENKQ